MPIYEVDLDDGRTVTLESDSEPDESSIYAALESYQSPKEPSSFDLSERGVNAALDVFGKVQGVISNPAVGAASEMGRQQIRDEDVVANYPFQRDIRPAGSLEPQLTEQTGIRLPEPTLPYQAQRTFVGSSPHGEIGPTPDQRIEELARVGRIQQAGPTPEEFAEVTSVPGREVLFQPFVPFPKFEVKDTDSDAVAVGKSAVNLVLSLPEFFGSPGGVLTLLSGGIAPTATAGVFTADLLHSIGKQIKDTYSNWNEMSAPKKAEALVNILGTAYFAKKTGEYAIKGAGRFAESYVPRGAGISSPETIKPAGQDFVEKPITTEVPSASSQPKAAEVYGDVRPQPIEVQPEVPVERSGAGVQPLVRSPQAEVLPAVEPQKVAEAEPATVPPEQSVADYSQWRNNLPFSPPSFRNPALTKIEADLINMDAARSVLDKPTTKTGERPTNEQLKTLDQAWMWLRSQAGFKWAVDSGNAEAYSKVRAAQPEGKSASGMSTLSKTAPKASGENVPENVQLAATPSQATAETKAEGQRLKAEVPPPEQSIARGSTQQTKPSIIQPNETELKTPEAVVADEILGHAVSPIKRLGERSEGNLAFDISDWTRAAQTEAQGIADTFVYSPSGSSKVIIEFPKGKRPNDAIAQLVDAIKSGDGPGSGWLPISQADAIKSAFKSGKPVLAEAANQHSLRPPRGYVEEGGIYRRMDSPPPRVGSAKSQPSAQLRVESPAAATVKVQETVVPKQAAAQVQTEVAKPTPEKGQAEVQGAVVTSVPPLGPTATPMPSLPPKSQRLIINDLAKGLNLPIRFGRLTTNKYAGYFKRIQNIIGAKRPNDVPVVSHEAGHKLDDIFSLSKDASIAAELDVLGDPSTPGSGSSWTPSKTKSYKMGEGVAEFTRYWLTDPTHAQKTAPATFKAFENALNSNKDLGDTMRQAQEDIRVWKNAEPQARLRSHISIGENPNKTRYTVSQLTRDLIDDLHFVRLAVEHAEKGTGTPLPPSQNPYLLARNLRGSYGMADTFVRSGVVDFNSRGVKLGTSLEDALKPVAGRLNDFRDWIVAKRAQELHKQGRQTGLVDSDVQFTANKFDTDPDFQKAFDDVKAWNDALLDYAVDGGLIERGAPATATTPATGSFLIRDLNQDYVPFHRVFEVGAGEAPSQQAMGIGMGLNVGKPGSLKALKGSARDIVDPLETMVKNAYAIITASEKASINRAVAGMANLPDMGRWVERIAAPKAKVEFPLERIRDQLDRAGANTTGIPDSLLLSFFRPTGSAPFGENIIRVVRNGENQFYRLNRDLHDTFQALDLEDSGKIVRILSQPAQLLRAGVVLEPSFSVANALRDTFSAAVIGKYGSLPFETTIRGIGALIGNRKLVSEWAASGGKSSVEASYFDRTKLQKFLAERISKDLTVAERAMVITKSPLTALRWLTSLSEEATRIGEYKKAYDQLTKGGMPEGEARRLAAFESRDRQDFAKGGAKTKIIRHLAAFWNANLQANVKLAQSFKQRPIRTTLQGLAFVTTAKLLEQAVNWDDEDYWDRPQWERDLFFLIPAGKDKAGHTRFIRIPTPFEVGLIFGTLPGRLLQWAKKNDPEAMKGFPALALKQSVPNPTPSAYQLPFELRPEKGWDYFRGRQIVPESIADLPAEEEWTEQTSTLAKKVGKRLGVSPMKIDHAISQTTGGLGKLATGAQTPGQRFVTSPLGVSNQQVQDFYETLETLRESRAANKKGDTREVRMLVEFEAASRRMAQIRNAARALTDDAAKLKKQDEIFQLAKQTMANYRKGYPGIPQRLTPLRPQRLREK